MGKGTLNITPNKTVSPTAKDARKTGEATLKPFKGSTIPQSQGTTMSKQARKVGAKSLRF
jgi:hypothetical protein